MGIGWLWHFAHSGDEGVLRVQNERRAAAFHARWRSLCGSPARLSRLLRDARRAHASRRELDALSEDLLRDLGLRRDVDGTVFAARPEPRPPRRTHRLPPIRIREPLARFPEGRRSTRRDLPARNLPAREPPVRALPRRPDPARPGDEVPADVTVPPSRCA